MYYFNSDTSVPSNEDQLHNARVTHYFDGEAPTKNKRRRNRREQKQRHQQKRESYQW